MSAVIFNSDRVRALKAAIALGQAATIWSDALDPTVIGFAAALGDMFLSTTTYLTYKKTGAGNTAWTAQLPVATGDIPTTSFALSNNQSSPANVTGLVFANASVRSFIAQVSVFVDATVDLFQEVTITGIQKGSDWDYTIVTAGDDSLVTFTVTTAGQVQYVTPSYTGFTSGKLSFRAQVTLV